MNKDSTLVSYVRRSPNTYGGRSERIIYFTPHCVVGQTSVEGLGAWFERSTTQASSTYGIGKDGSIAQYLPESYHSWCTSSYFNDARAITIECASDTYAPYAMYDVVYQSLINLAVDICKRLGRTKLIWFGDKNKTLAYKVKDDEMVITVHRWFANKSCPGDWLYSRLGNLAKEVTKRLQGEKTNVVEPIATSAELYRVRKSWDDAKTQIGAFKFLANAKSHVERNKGYKVYDSQGKQIYPEITLTTPEKTIDELAKEVIAGKWGTGQTRIDRLKAGGYDPITIQQLVNTKLGIATKTNQQIADEVLAGKWGNGTDRKNKLTAAGYDYNVIQTIVNQTKSTTTHISKSGTWKFNTAVKIRSTPSTSSGDTGLIYTSGMTVNIASTQVADGYIWGKYTSTSGQTRYVALQKVNGIAYGKWV